MTAEPSEQEAHLPAHKRGALGAFNTRYGWPILKDSVTSWLRHEGMRLAASLSLYILLSLVPLLILTTAMMSSVFSRPVAQQAVVTEFRSLVGDEGAHAIQTVITHAKTPNTRGLAPAIGIFVLLFAASSVFGELQSALNKIWEVPSKARNGLLAIVRSRLLSFGMVLAIGFLSLASLLASAALAVLGSYFTHALTAPAWLLSTLSSLVSLLGTTVLIALVLRYVPDIHIRWRDVWEGALASAALFTVGKSLIGLHLGNAAVGSAYGAAGSVVVVIVWVYYSAMIFYFGAEFTRARARAARRLGALVGTEQGL